MSCAGLVTVFWIVNYYPCCLEAGSRPLPSVTLESDCTMCVKSRWYQQLSCLIFDNDILRYYQLLAKYSTRYFKNWSTIFIPYSRIFSLIIATFKKIIELPVVCYCCQHEPYNFYSISILISKLYHRALHCTSSHLCAYDCIPEDLGYACGVYDALRNTPCVNSSPYYLLI